MSWGSGIVSEFSSTCLFASEEPGFLAHAFQEPVEFMDIVNPQGIRFASTRWADGTSVAGTLTLTYKLKRQSGAIIDSPPVVTVITPQTFNRLQLLGTNDNPFGGEDPLFQTQSDLLTQFASASSSPSHTVNPSAGLAARSESAVAIAQKITESTFMVALTHGSAYDFSDSHSNFVVHFDFGLGLPDVHVEVMQKPSAGIPPYNLVCFWACATLSGSPHLPVIGYEIQSPDQAYLGFARSIQVDLWTAQQIKEHGFPPHWSVPKEGGISDHASDFLDHLWLGDTVADALDKANENFPPIHSLGNNQYEQQPMEFRGDEYTRMRYVYLTGPERTILNNDISKINVWWILLPVTNP